MLLDADESQLVLVDYQARLMPAIHDGPAVLANARLLARVARTLGVPVWGTEQNPSRLGANDADLRALCDRTLAKMHFSAAEEGLGEWLRPPAKPQQGGNARSLPKHLQKPAQQAPERGTIVKNGCRAGRSHRQHVCLRDDRRGDDGYRVQSLGRGHRPYLTRPSNSLRGHPRSFAGCWHRGAQSLKLSA